MSNTSTRYADVPGIAIQVSHGVVVASIQIDLDDDILARFGEDLLSIVHRSDARGVILDASGLETLDSDEFNALRRIISTVEIMGAESVLVGLRPGVVSALIEVGADIDGLRAAIDMDAAFALLQPTIETDDVEEPLPDESAELSEDISPGDDGIDQQGPTIESNQDNKRWLDAQPDPEQQT